jgi:cytochrome c553
MPEARGGDFLGQHGLAVARLTFDRPAKGRLSVMAALTASIRSWVATSLLNLRISWSAPFHFFQHRSLQLRRYNLRSFFHDCLSKMIKLITSVFMVFVASATSVAYAQRAGDAKAGETKIAMCIGCHGIKGYQASFPEVTRYPKFPGQSAAYIVSALNAYQRVNVSTTMRGVAASLMPKHGRYCRLLRGVMEKTLPKPCRESQSLPVP